LTQQPIRSLLGAAALLASTALPGLAQDQVISWIYCGDTLDPVHVKYIGEWEAANAGWKVEPELVGWAQCQDKATTLAAAGSPAALADVGSRPRKEV
jgi:multiple sugar transport system substrate-binding protein